MDIDFKDIFKTSQDEIDGLFDIVEGAGLTREEAAIIAKGAGAICAAMASGMSESRNVSDNMGFQNIALSLAMSQFADYLNSDNIQNTCAMSFSQSLLKIGAGRGLDPMKMFVSITERVLKKNLSGITANIPPNAVN